ncbi:MAG: hypothetical protein IJ504_01345 [Bacteroidales bacterium]|nr:hypothetical protein [Bacteroidales bacterium]
MTLYFCKALDRPVDIFGLKGKWITVFLVLAGLFVLAGIVVGVMMGTGIGVSVAIVGAVCSFVVCISMQGRTPCRELEKLPLEGRSRGCVKRRETLCRILLEHEDEPSWFAASQRARDGKENENS